MVKCTSNGEESHQTPEFELKHRYTSSDWEKENVPQNVTEEAKMEKLTTHVTPKHFNNVQESRNYICKEIEMTSGNGTEARIPLKY